MKKIFFLAFMTIGITTYAQTKIPALKITDSLRVKGVSSFEDSVKVNRSLNVSGTLRVNDLNVKGNFKLGNDFILNEQALGSGDKILNITATTTGTDISTPMPPNFFPCFSNTNVGYFSTVLAVPGYATFYGANPQFPSAKSALNIGYNGQDGFIDATGGSVPWQEGASFPAPKLLINYHCGKDVYICTGTATTYTNPYGGPGVAGGVVSMGPHVEIGMPVRDKLVALNMKLQNKVATAIQILNPILKEHVFRVQADGGVFIRQSGSSGKKAFVVQNYSNSTEPFVVYADGKTRIGVQRPLAPYNDAMLAVDGKVACRSFYVTRPASWADYVFKNKNTEVLSDVEKFIAQNQHLPGIPSEAEVLDKGYDLNEMDAKLLSKIEMLYQHIIEQDKLIKELQSKLEAQK